MKRLTAIAIILAVSTLWGFKPSMAESPKAVSTIPTFAKFAEREVKPAIEYRHGDCSWLPEVALSAGWKPKQIPRLTQIVLRESGCCPNRAGGDIVNKNCVITGVSEWTHRSDSGLLQINGVHWKPDHAQYHGLVCKQMGICTQPPLMDAKTNLIAGKLLFDVAGWKPWGF